MAQVFLTETALRLSGPLTLPHLGSLEVEILRLLRDHPQQTVTVDPGAVTELDTAGAVFLEELPRRAREAAGRTVRLGPLPTALRPFQDFVGKRRRRAEKEPPPGRGFLERLGGRVAEFNAALLDLLFLASDLTASALTALFRPSGLRRGSLVDQAVVLGSSALPIIALILFLIGAVSSLQAAAQLRKFGADILVAELLAIGMTRELAPLMTAIIVAGRSGSAIAAEIATMKFTEELDALETMALDPLRFVAVPKLWAMVLCLPMLTVMADLIGIAGGLSVGITIMNIAPQAFVHQLLEALFLRDILSGLVKSFSFAWAITVVGVFHGLQYSGGAAGVGRSTTAGVVTSIFVIIVLDSFWGLVFYLG